MMGMTSTEHMALIGMMKYKKKHIYKKESVQKNTYAMNNIRSFSIDFLIAVYACYLIQALSDFWSLRLSSSLTCTHHILKRQAQPRSDSLSTLRTCRANIRFWRIL